MFASFLACSCQIAHRKAVGDCFLALPLSHTHIHRGNFSLEVFTHFENIHYYIHYYTLLTFIMEALGISEDLVTGDHQERVFSCGVNRLREWLRGVIRFFSSITRVKEAHSRGQDGWGPGRMPLLCDFLHCSSNCSKGEQKGHF